MAEQSYTTENPKPREVQVDKVEEQVDAQAFPARPDYALDSKKVDVHEVRVSLDEQVSADHPAAVIVPPEGRGSNDLPIHKLSAPSPEQLLSSGKADEATAVVDGKEVKSSEAAKKRGE